jgi:hypothetical protein
MNDGEHGFAAFSEAGIDFGPALGIEPAPGLPGFLETEPLDGFGRGFRLPTARNQESAKGEGRKKELAP